MQRMSQASGRGLPERVTPGPHEFGLTIISDVGLSRRLLSEFEFVWKRARLAWPAFKREPISFTGQLLADSIRQLKHSLARPHVLPAFLTALLLISFTVFGLLTLDRRPRVLPQADLDNLSNVAILDFSRGDWGIGTDGLGRVGFSSGRGEGSKPQPKSAHGGGGSGAHDLLPPQVGKIPQPSEIQAPVPTTPRLNPALPVAGIDIDPALWRDLPERNFGDPRSTSNAKSNGPGEGGAIGSGNGLGFGEGEGPGFGPGTKGNMGGGEKEIGGGGTGSGEGNGCGLPGCAGRGQVFTLNQVEERARVLSKPEPQYTEEARKQDVTGTVVLRVVLSSSGEVTNIRAIQSLPAGLTEKAIAAARQIRFIPARRDGHPVSMFMQLEYNFNLY